jgi:hypothetical protein
MSIDELHHPFWKKEKFSDAWASCFKTIFAFPKQALISCIPRLASLWHNETVQWQVCNLGFPSTVFLDILVSLKLLRGDICKLPGGHSCSGCTGILY